MACKQVVYGSFHNKMENIQKTKRSKDKGIEIWYFIQKSYGSWGSKLKFWSKPCHPNDIAKFTLCYICTECSSIPFTWFEFMNCFCFL